MTTIPDEDWKGLLRSALDIVRALEERGVMCPNLTMGGNTVLMLRFEQRPSHNIDLFVSDVRYLSLVSPRRNDYVAAVVSSYSEGANCVTLELPQGVINFTASGRAIPVEKFAEFLEFEGKQIRLDTTAEILGKKLLFESARLRPRDIFDMAAAIEFDPKSAGEAVRAAASKVAILDRRMDELGRMRPERLDRDILVLDRGRTHLLSETIARVRCFIQEAVALASPKRNRFDPMATVLSAIENASSVYVRADEVLVALRTGEGAPSHLRALFGDVAFETLIGVGIRYGISNAEIGNAYARAVRAAGASNPELDEWCSENLEASPGP